MHPIFSSSTSIGLWSAGRCANKHVIPYIVAQVLGAIIAATAYAVIPPRPSPDLCWFWADPAMINGYWDYC